MKQFEFESTNRDFWASMADYLDNESSTPSADNDIKFPSNHRKVCQHLAIAKSRRYSSSLVVELNNLAQKGYEKLYTENSHGKGNILQFISSGFPEVLRENKPFLLVAGAIFVLPYVLMMIAVMINDQLIYSLMAHGDVRSMESMYDPSLRKLGRERQSDSDIYMFGFYIYNNIGIAFKCFATGLFLGIGSLFTLAFNGVYIGAVSGHLTALGYTETFYPFVIGHGSFELTAIVFSGAAGLKLGYSLLAPGNLTRISALQNAAKDAIKIMYGVFIMLMIAAFIEAFWSSSSTLSNWVKYSVGASLWALVIYYCFYYGRNKIRPNAVR